MDRRINVLSDLLDFDTSPLSFFFSKHHLGAYHIETYRRNFRKTKKTFPSLQMYPLPNILKGFCGRQLECWVKV